jgi:hypothetical protein
MGRWDRDDERAPEPTRGESDRAGHQEPPFLRTGGVESPVFGVTVRAKSRLRVDEDSSRHEQPNLLGRQDDKTA